MLVKVLSAQLANMIAAGEVVERPSSVAKELCENSIDAGATAVTVDITGGGLKKLTVTDNGCGLHPDDMETAFLRHATSKISSPSDLDSILTLGFRGEALASIAAVANVTMVSKMDGADGKLVSVSGGKILRSEPIGCPVGTTVTVENLFFNTPARMKFLKKDYTEAGYIEEAVRKLSLAHPEISFRFVSDGKEKIFTPGDGNLKSAAYAIYGKEVSGALVPLDYTDEAYGAKISGLIGNITLYKKNRSLQSFYVNNRCIVNRTLTLALEEAFKGMIPIGCFPAAILKVEISPSLVDVNVHPAKLEVKFFEENKIYSAVYWAVKNALSVKTVPVIDVAEKPQESTAAMPSYTKPLSGSFVGAGSVKDSGGSREYNYKYAFGKPEKENVKIYEEITKADFSAPQKPLEEKAEQKAENTSPLLAEESKIRKETSTAADTEFVQTAMIDSGDSYKIIGQLFNTYILIEEGENLVLIDQHAAHERLIYERLVTEQKNKKIVPQMLLSPETVRLSPTEFQTALENLDFFAEIGWELEEFGANTVAVRGVPYVISKEQVKDTLIEIIGNLRDGKQETRTAKEDRILYTIACRSAVKGHDKLTLPEIEELVRQVKNSEKTITCPHGRPVTTAVTKAFIEKMFKRN
ncbi:MAG: DNA mismatch repair endonuclease MutL [Ruminococcaceae bacterium]|jgi:DNA mismatch repair protein MutL|nr:DNA mismatch repair endonuclease MutL [Oscillospiraceae bacterium]